MNFSDWLSPVSPRLRVVLENNYQKSVHICSEFYTRKNQYVFYEIGTLDVESTFLISDTQIISITPMR